MNHDQLDRTKHWLETHGDVLFDLIRIYLGITLFTKGVYFATHREYFTQLTEQVSGVWFAPAFLGHLVIGAHLAGGFFLTIGLLSRIAAFIQVPVLAGAVFFIHLPQTGLAGTPEGIEYAALVLFLTSLVALFGAGRWSLDYLIFRRPAAVSVALDEAEESP